MPLSLICHKQEIIIDIAGKESEYLQAYNYVLLAKG